MPEETVNQLSIKLTADTTEAVKSIKKVGDSLKTLNERLGGSGLKSGPALLKSLGDGVKGLSDLSQAGAGLTSLAKGLNAVGKSNAEGISNVVSVLGHLQNATRGMTFMTQFGESLKDFSGGLNALSRVKVDGITNLRWALRSIVDEVRSLSALDLDALDKYTASMERLKGLKFNQLAKAREEALKESSPSVKRHRQYVDTAELQEAQTGIEGLRQELDRLRESGLLAGEAVRKIEIFSDNDPRKKFGAGFSWIDGAKQHGHFFQNFDDEDEKTVAEIQSGLISDRQIYDWQAFDEERFGESVQDLKDRMEAKISDVFSQDSRIDATLRWESGMINEALGAFSGSTEEALAAVNQLKEDLKTGLALDETETARTGDQTGEAFVEGVSNGMEGLRDAVEGAMPKEIRIDLSPIQAFNQEMETMRNDAKAAGVVLRDAFLGGPLYKTLASCAEGVKNFVTNLHLLERIKATKAFAELQQVVASVRGRLAKLSAAFNEIKQKMEDARQANERFKASLSDLKGSLNGSNDMGFLEAFASVGVAFGGAFAKVVAVVASIGKTVFGIIGGVIKGVAGLIKSGIGLIVGIISSVVNVIAGIVGTVVNVVSGIVSAIAGILKTIVSVVASIVSAVVTVVGTVVKAVASVIRAGFNLVVGAVRAIVNGVVTVIKGIVGVVQKVLSPIVTMIGQLAKTISEKLGSAVASIGKVMLQTVVSPFTSFAEAVQGLVTRVQGIFKRFARTAFTRVIRNLTSAVTQGLKEGIDNLYQFSKVMGNHQFAKTMDTYASSMLYFKNSIAAAAAPLLNTFIPALQSVINTIVSFINILNQFFAALGGASGYTKATKYATEYAKAAGGASKAQKDLLADWDELNVIQSKDSGGGGGSDLDFSKMFEEAEIDNPIKRLADEIREYIESDDWTGLGALLSSKINGWIDGVDWHGWGVKIGTWIDNAIHVAYGFLENLNAGAIGAAIAKFLNGGIKSVDATTLGQTLALRITKLFDAALGFLRTFNWLEFGQWVHDLIVGSLRGLQSWFTSKDWNQIASDIKAGVKGFLAGVQGADIAKTFWSTLVEAIKAGATILTSLMGGIWDYVWNGAGEPDASGVKNSWAGLKSVFQPYIDEAGGDFWVGIVNGIIDNLPTWAEQILTAIKTEILDPIDDKFEKQFGVRPFEALLNGIETFTAPFTSAFQTMIDSAVNSYNTAKYGEVVLDGSGAMPDSYGAPVVNKKGIGGILKEAWEDFLGWYQGDFTDGLNGAAEKLGGYLGKALGGDPGGAALDAWNDFSVWAGSILQSALSATFTTICSIIDDKMNVEEGTTASKVSKAWEDFKTWFDEDFPQIKEDLEGIYDGIVEFLEDPEAVVSELWESFKKWVSEHMSPDLLAALCAIFVGIQTFLQDPVTSVETTWSGFKSKMVSWIGEIVDKINALARAAQKVLDTLGVKYKVGSVSVNDSGGIDYTPGHSETKQENVGRRMGSTDDPASLYKTATSSGVSGPLREAAKEALEKKFPSPLYNWHADGAFNVPTGEVYIAREAGSEMIGRIGHHNSVVNNDQIIDGIAAGVQAANYEEVTLLRRQNDLLQQLLTKEYNIGVTPSADWGRFNARSAEMYAQRTGRR